MSTRHIAAEHARLADLTPKGSSGGASKRFRQKLAADGFTVDEGFRLKPGYLYTVVRAISARVNQNYDGWPSDELKKAYKTFIGKPVFVNHENHDPTKARGVVVAARYAENGMDKYIEVVQEIDAKRFPKLAHEIKTGGLDSVSMGAEAGFTICSYCKNKATDLHDMCEHVQLHKGKTLRKFDRRTGNTEDILVFESCHKISFFELSYVFEPADETAVASKVVVAGLHKHSADCPPGMDCSRNMGLANGLEQITKDSPNNPVNQVSYTPGNVGDPGSSGGAGGYQGSGQSGRDGLNPGAMSAYDEFAKEFPGLSMGGFNPVVDQPWDEHATGDAFDIMTSELDQGNSIRDRALKNPNVKHVIWQQHLYRPDGSSYKMEDRFSPTENHMDHVHINMGGGVAPPAAAPAPVAQPKAPKATGVQQTQRAAGKYTKEDFAIGDGKKPWERDTGTSRAPIEEEAADLKEIEAMIHREAAAWRCSEGHTTSTRQNYCWVCGRRNPNPEDLTPIKKKVEHDDLKEIEAMMKTAVTAPLQPNFSPHEADPEDSFDPDTADEEIEDNPGGNSNGWEQHLGRPFDPDRELYTHLNLHAAKNGLPGIWSISQKFKHHPETGELVNRNYVVAYAPELHLKGARAHVERGAAQRYAEALEQHLANPYHPVDNPDGVKPPKRTVHAGVWGTLTDPPSKPLPYSGIEYHPGDRGGQFVHRDNKEPVHDMDLAHMSRDKRVYGFAADNWGRDHEPQLVVDPDPAVNASNRHTVWPPLDKQSHRKAMAREAAINALYFSGPSVPVAPTPDTIRKVARRRALKLAFGEKEAPIAVDTLREEGSALEDDNNDDERYVDPPEFENAISSPQELQDPDLSQAGQINREQELEASDPAGTGQPGPADPNAAPQAPQQQFMTLQIPIPPQGMPQVPMQASPPVMPTPQIAPAAPPQQAPGQQPPPQQIAASVLDYFDGYYGRRVANWLDAIEAGRDMNPAEVADYRRQAGKLSTLENGRELSTTNRNPTKGTANMARNSIASRNKVATTGRRQHFAEGGPLVDGGDRSRNDQGEQEEAFISQTPPEVPVDFPADDAPNISNTENNLVARVQKGRAQLLRDAQQLASLRQRRAFDEAGGPTAEIVDPTVNVGPEGEALTGDGFVSADPNDGVVPTQPKDASLRAFQAFDGWLTKKTGKSSRRHSEATLKKAAAAFSREAGISPQALFPALGIVLREARKNDKQANTKGAKMRKRADEKLEVAAPDGRVDVEAPVSNTTDAEAQASQFDLHDFGNNAGDNVADPDLSTDQNWAPGEASKTSARVKTAGGLLAMRCAEGMIAAGLEPDSRERKYQLAAEFEQMNRGLIQDRVALLERFAAVRLAERRKVASGSSRGAARSPIPAGLGGGTRTASAGMRLAANDPSNDSSLFI